MSTSTHIKRNPHFDIDCFDFTFSSESARESVGCGLSTLTPSLDGSSTLGLSHARVTRHNHPSKIPILIFNMQWSVL